MSFHGVHHFLAPSKRKTGQPWVKQKGGLELLIATTEDYIFAKILGQRFEAGNAVLNFETVDYTHAFAISTRLTVSSKAPFAFSCYKIA